jgi:hypothetical protein
LRRSPSAPHRRAHLSSNVRPHVEKPCCYPTGSAPDGVGLRSKVCRVPLRNTIAWAHESGRYRVVLIEKFREQSAYKRCVPRRSQAPLPAASFSSSWCRRRSVVVGLRQHRSGGNDWTHRIELCPRLASQQQEKYEARFSVALG